ncbi:MAG: TOPRIM nucleotidyl transferase/hydrolase domain-containing protein [Pseudolysinimonas sp.]
MVDQQLCRDAVTSGIRHAVLVEGRSDAVAVAVLADRLGRDLVAEGVIVIPMGGAMSIARFFRVVGPNGLGWRVVGLCDEGERSHFDRLLTVDAVFACERDLEEELIRSLGVVGAEEVFDQQGDLARFRTFQRQPAQRGRPAEAQLHRFLGSISGRKERYAGALVGALDLDAVPGPLGSLLAQLPG